MKRVVIQKTGFGDYRVAAEKNPNLQLDELGQLVPYVGEHFKDIPSARMAAAQAGMCVAGHTELGSGG